MNLEKIRKLYLIGICGTAMASLAGLLKEKGHEVCGSDSNVYPPMSTQLEQLGVKLYSGYDSRNLAGASPDLVIPGNAVPRGNPEVEEMLNLRLPYMSMAEAVREFFLREKKPVVIAGTHGKTTTTSIAAWLLQSSRLNPSFLVGGIPLNFNRSYQWNPESAHFVIEGDEYDTGFMDRRPKFVQYLPDAVILNPIEYDHADLYPDFAAVENAFWQLIKVVPANGRIIVSRDSDTAFHLAQKGYSKISTFGFHPESEFRITSVGWQNGQAVFCLNDQEYRMRSFGAHNIANASAVAVLGHHLELTSIQIQQAFDTFKGVKRRMEFRGEANQIEVYDDFAHHPTAIRTTLEGAKLAFPNARIWGIFEPRSWSSRRNVFQQEFAAAFTSADFAIIAKVFEAEKVPAELRLDPQRLVKEIQQSGPRSAYMPDQDELIRFVSSEARAGDKLILMSNGSFDGLHEKLLTKL